MKKVLFISNGHGEDLVAAAIIRQLGGAAECAAFPLVGAGHAFEPLKIKVLGPQQKLPSGGFSLRNLNYLVQDLTAGLFGHILAAFNQLRKLRRQFDLVVAIGDIVPLLGALAVKAPFVFIGVNKSSYYRTFGYGYTPWEKLLLQRARKVFVRDKQTEQDLTGRGFKVKTAEYVGNPLMDCISQPLSPIPFPLNKGEGEKGDGGKFTIGLLPGTRDDAKLNLEDFQKIAEELVKLKNSSSVTLCFLIATTLIPLPEYLENRPFAEVLTRSDLIIGLSGTGNEQAAGLSVPVVAFYGRGSQYDPRFADAQKELLGEALSLIRDNDPLTVAAEVWELLRHPQKRAAMGLAGRERMGEAGAIAKIADYIKKEI